MSLSGPSRCRQSYRDRDDTSETRFRQYIASVTPPCTRKSRSTHCTSVYTTPQPSSIAGKTTKSEHALQSQVATTTKARVHGRTSESGTVLIGTIGPLYSNTVISTPAVDGWTVTFGTARRGLDVVPAHPRRRSFNQRRCSEERRVN